MKPNIGMLYPVAAPVDAYVPYTSISYDDGFVIDEARGASISWDTEDGEFYGDDVLLDSANGVIGYSIEFEPTGLKNTVRAALLGEVKASSGNTYTITGAPAPDVGFGFIRRMRDDTGGTVAETFEAWWFYKIKFAMPNEESRTKERNIEWRTPTLNGRGAGVFLAAAAEHPSFCEHEDFATLAAAKAYLNGKAGIS